MIAQLRRAASFALFCLVLSAATAGETAPDRSDEYTLAGDTNFLTDHDPIDTTGRVQVVVEIPAGTNAKWEVMKPDGRLQWELEDGKPRVVRYLPYPGNYGMVPKTLLPAELGGDGDPLDVILLGSAVERGSVVKSKLIGVLKLIDGGETDDKLLAVAEGSPLYGVDSLEELNGSFGGVTAILETWFTHYKGPGEIESRGFGEAAEARRILDAAIAAYEKSEGP